MATPPAFFPHKVGCTPLLSFLKILIDLPISGCAGSLLFHRLSLVAEHRFPIGWLLLLWTKGSILVAHGLGCSLTRGIFPDQGWNPCPPVNSWSTRELPRLFSYFISCLLPFLSSHKLEGIFTLWLHVWVEMFFYFAFQRGCSLAMC